MEQTRDLISQWRKCLNDYRAASKKISRQIIQITNDSDDDQKEKIIDAFGNSKLLIILLLAIDYKLLKTII